MTESIRDFLLRFTEEELTERGILRGQTCILQGTSVDPLIALMKAQKVKRLEFPQRSWFLDVDYNFNNPHSVEHVTNVKQLSHLGNVFNLQNVHINPYYTGGTPVGSPGPIDDRQSLLAKEQTLSFGLERDLQAALREHIEQLEPGLKVVDGGSERSVGSGRIDITAQDREGKLVVIELKAGPARPDALTQLLAYMVALGEGEQRPVRGMLVAGEFPERLVLAA